MSVRELAAAAALFLPFCANAGDDPFLAIRNNDLPSLKSQMAKGLDVNRRDRRGATLLMHAAAFGSPEAMKLLLDAGADVNAKSQLEATALIWGAADPAKVRLLVDRGADVNARSKLGRTPLMSAAAIAGASETVRLLLAKGADPQAKDTHGNSALLTAADAGDPETVRLLLEKGLDANSADEGGNTALMSAAGNCDLEAVKLLLAKGADVNAANRFGGKVKNGPIALTKLTALHLAAPFGSPELIRTLLAAGAKVKALDSRRMQPMTLGRRRWTGPESSAADVSLQCSRPPAPKRLSHTRRRSAETARSRGMRERPSCAACRCCSAPPRSSSGRAAAPPAITRT